MNPALTTDLYGSLPIGLELQVTMWGYKRSGPLGQVAFRRYRIINKSGFSIYHMYLSQWSDADIGDYTNDFTGCDSILSMGFAYNGDPVDNDFQQYGLAPAAIGYDLLQGPIIFTGNPADTAIFDMKKLPGHRNQPMTSFGYLAAGSAIDDPQLGSYDGTLQWYNLLRGFIPDVHVNNPTPYTHGSGQNAGQPTTFPVNGDPVLGFGDIDGQGNNFPPGDRRMAICSRPFKMVNGDTQEVVVSIVGGISDYYLSSVNQMKLNDQHAQQIYNDLFQLIPYYLRFDASVEYTSQNQTDVHFTALNEYADSIDIFIKQYDNTQIAQLILYDDGLHGDGMLSDGEFGNDWQTAPYASGLYVDANVLYEDGTSFYWDELYENLTTSGPVLVPQMIVGSDNLNHDGIANPGENIRYTVEVQNQSSYSYTNVQIAQIATLEGQFITNLSTPNSQHVIPQLANNSSYTWPYSPNDNFYQFNISSSHPGNDSIHIVFLLEDENHNTWIDTTALWVEPLSNQPQDQLMDHITGNAYGRLGYRLFDPNQITGHSYQVNFNDTLPNGEVVYQLKDLTTGSVLLSNQPYPDEYGHNSQVVDGFFVTRGTTVLEGIQDWDWQSAEPRWLTGVNAGFAIFFGGVGFGAYAFGSTIDPEDAYTVKVVFDSSMVTNCAVYRRDLGYAYQGIGTFYGAAYDYSDAVNPRRVNIVFTEDNNYKPADMTWNPDENLGAREYLFLMDSDYDPVTAGGYDDNNVGISADVVWAAWTQLEVGHSFLETPADFYLFFERPISFGNIYEFMPQWTGIIGKDDLPLTFELMQNYPNPFNPTTNIRFSLAKNVKVKLEIFNILGQKVTTIVNEKLNAGYHVVSWNGSNDSGLQVGSGIYFYRLQAEDFVSIKKMIFLK